MGRRPANQPDSRSSLPVGEAIKGSTIAKHNRGIVTIRRGLQLALNVEDRPLRGTFAGEIILPLPHPISQSVPARRMLRLGSARAARRPKPDLLRFTCAAGCPPVAAWVLAPEAKCQKIRRYGEWAQHDLKASGSGHHATDRDEIPRFLRPIVDPVSQSAGAVGSDGHLIGGANSVHGMREGPHDRMRDNEVIAHFGRL